MRRYETIFIVTPDLSDEERTPLFERIKDLISKHDGFLFMFDEWGSKKLAYEIKKKARGYYVRLDYCGTGTLIDEIERLFRIDERVLKYMTILLEKDVDIEKLKAEVVHEEVKDDQSDRTEESETAIDTSVVPEPEIVENETTQPESKKEEL